MNARRLFIRNAPSSSARSLTTFILRAAATGPLFLAPVPSHAETVLDPSNPSNFTQDGTQTFTPGTVLTLTDSSIGDRIALFANDADAAAGLNLDVVATFQFNQVAPANVNANNRLEINDGTRAAIAQCLILPGGIKGIGLYAGGIATDAESYPIFVPVDWQSEPTTIRLRRWANGDAELVEINGNAPNPRAVLAGDQLPLTSRPATSVGFGLASVEARAVVEYSEFFSELRVVFVDGFESSTDCAWNARAGSSQVCEVMVKSIQTGEASGEVRVEFAVVTALTADRKHLWVADSHVAAPSEGIFVDRGSGAAPLDNSFTVGTAVQVRGSTHEEGAGTALNSLTEIVATEEPVNLGFWQAPVPLLVPPGFLADVADLATGEPYEGVLVRVEDVEAGATQAGNRVELVDPGDPSDLLLMDDELHLYGVIAGGSDFKCVTGVMDLEVELDQRRLLPRSAGDLVSSTPPAFCP